MLSPASANKLLILLSGLAFAVTLFFPAIPQDPAYHLFADRRSLLNIPNLLNVLSNAPFLIVGGLGLNYLHQHKLNILAELNLHYQLFFAAILFVGLGSAYYHLLPNNQTLIWDRLPMIVAFMAFFASVIAEYIELKLGRLLMWPFILFGLFSVLYWYSGELQHHGDLRWYGLVQFLPLLLLPIILLSYPPRYSHHLYYWWFLGCYGLAKIAELADLPVYQFLHIISGHSLKHLLAGLGCYIFLIQLQQRQHISK